MGEEEMRRLMDLELKKVMEKKRKQAEARRAARLQAKILKRFGKDLKSPVESAIEAAHRAAELEQEKREAMEKLKDQSGIWRKEARSKWNFERGVSKSKAQMVSVTEESAALIDDMQGASQRQMLQRRWRAMTGLEITKDHVVMGGS